MALCTTTGPFGLLSGTFGLRSAAAGVVANPTAGRNVLRQFVIPANPATGPQSQARSRFLACVNAYSTLTQSQIQPWRDFAAAIQRTGRLGLPYKPSAANMYIGVNSLRLMDGQTIDDDPPPLELLPALDPDNVVLNYTSGSPDTYAVEWQDTLPAGSFVLCRMSRALPTQSRLARRNELISCNLPAASIVLSSAETVPVVQARIAATSTSYHGVLLQSISAGYVPGAACWIPQRTWT